MKIVLLMVAMTILASGQTPDTPVQKAAASAERLLEVKRAEEAKTGKSVVALQTAFSSAAKRIVRKLEPQNQALRDAAVKAMPKVLDTVAEQQKAQAATARAFLNAGTKVLEEVAK